MKTKTDEQQRAAFEAAWVKSPYQDYPERHKDIALYWWQAAISLDRQQRGEPVGMTSIADMCRILKEHYVEEAERTDCTILYTVTFDQLRAIYDRGRREGPQPADPAVKESLTVAEPVKEVSDEKLRAIAEMCAKSRSSTDALWQFDDLGLSLFIGRIAGLYLTAQQECGCCGRSDGCDPDCDAAPPAARALPEWEKHVRHAWRVLREQDSTIPGDILDMMRDRLLASADQAQQDADKADANTGHGHVLPRPDGVKARCGGPGICKECSRDAARAQQGGRP